MMGIAVKKGGSSQSDLLPFVILIAAAVRPRFGYVASAISTLIGYTVLLVLQTLLRPYLTWRFHSGHCVMLVWHQVA
jgi:hypothetical protein